MRLNISQNPHRLRSRLPCGEQLWDLPFGKVNLFNMLFNVSQTLAAYAFGRHAPNNSGISDLVK
jgi:hypothetical protein